MIFYISLILLVVSLSLVSYRYTNYDKIISIFILFIMIFVGGFRDHIGRDYNSYIRWYLDGGRDDSFEFGFLAIMKIFRYFQIDYHYLFFFFSLSTYIFAYFGIRKYTKKSSLALTLFIFIPVLFLYSFALIRQILSVTIALYAFSFLLEKKYLIYFLLMFVGVSIHYSCLVPFFVFLFIFKYVNFFEKRILYLLMGLSFLISQIGIVHLLSSFLNNYHYLYYVSNETIVAVPLMKLVMINVMGFIVIYYYEKYKFQCNHQKYLLLAFIFSILFLNLFAESIDLTRIYIYFRIFEVIIVSEIIRFALLNKRKWLLGYISVFYVVPFFRAIIIDYNMVPNTLKFIPYKSLLIG